MREPDKRGRGGYGEYGGPNRVGDVCRCQTDERIDRLYGNQHPPDYEQAAAMAQGHNHNQGRQEGSSPVARIPGCRRRLVGDGDDRKPHAHQRVDPGDDPGQPEVAGHRLFFIRIIHVVNYTGGVR